MKNKSFFEPITIEKIVIFMIKLISEETDVNELKFALKVIFRCLIEAITFYKCNKKTSSSLMERQLAVPPLSRSFVLQFESLSRMS